MRLSPAAWFGSLGAGAVGATIAVVLLGSGHSAPQQPTYVLHQDAQTGAAVITSSAPASVKPVAPKLAAPTSTVVVKRQPAIQGDPVTDPTTTDAGTAVPAATGTVPAFQPIKDHPGNGPSSVNAGSIPTPTPSDGN